MGNASVVSVVLACGNIATTIFALSVTTFWVAKAVQTRNKHKDSASDSNSNNGYEIDQNFLILNGTTIVLFLCVTFAVTVQCMIKFIECLNKGRLDTFMYEFESDHAYTALFYLIGKYGLYLILYLR